MNRNVLIDEWLAQHLDCRFERFPLAGDASFRRYERIMTPRERYVLMDAPPPESPRQFTEVAKLLKSRDVRVPDIIAEELDLGLLLLSDFGDELYLHHLTPKTADALYQEAMVTLQKIYHTSAHLPLFDEVVFSEQLGLFQTWFLERHHQRHFSLEESESFLSTQAILWTNHQQQPFGMIHKDFHSRNLMVLSDNTPGVLDFQDAMLGPVTYDLVSLLQDCYIHWPRAQVEQWVKGYHEQLKLSCSSEQFLRWFDLTGLQRHIKNCGVFCRLAYRDGKRGYLNDLPRVLRYMTETIRRYPDLLAVNAWFESFQVVEMLE